MSSSRGDQQGFFYLNSERQPVGPYSLAELNELAQGGVVKGDTFISAEGWSAWKTWDELQAEQQPAGAVHPQGADPAPTVSGPVLGEACASERSSEMSAHATPEHVSPPEVVPWQLPVEKHFPWEVSPELARKAAVYETSGNYRAYDCRGAELLNRLMKGETFKALTYMDGQIRVYPDLVGIYLPKNRPWLLKRWVATSPGPLRPFMIFFYDSFSSLVLSLHTMYMRRKFPVIAKHILDEPKSSYAVKSLFWLSATSPRYWQKADLIGEVIQLLRVETRRGLSKQSMIVVVQDNRMENLSRRLTFAEEVVGWSGGLLKPKRRVFAFSVNEGESAADDAAAAMANVLGVPVTRAEFKFDRFLLK